MLALKHIASYFLLLIYSISFGHQMIPHHHHHEAEEGHVHVHHNEAIHNHCVEEEAAHNHVAHENHFDEGFIDYIGCILGGHEHNPATECELIQAVQDQKNHKKAESKTIDKLTDNAVLLAGTDEKAFSLSCAYCAASDQRMIALNKAKRGPPQS